MTEREAGGSGSLTRGGFMFAVDQHVMTDWGYGIVTESSARRVVIALEGGQYLNIVTGTPGYDRIKALD